MDGKLLVLCGERPTINDYEQFIDEKSRLITKRDGKYYNAENKEVQLDEHKKVIDGMGLLNPMITESTDHDILFVDWETIIPSNIESLQAMIQYAMSTEEIPAQFLFNNLKSRGSIMEKAHTERLLALDKFKERPALDYRFQAMEDFLQLFSKAIQNNGIVSILPTIPDSDEPEVNKARIKVLQSWKNRNEMLSKQGRERNIDVIEPMLYHDFGQIYLRAHDEIMRIMSKPDWYDRTSQEDEEPGGRD